MGSGADPLGKRALFWLPVEEEAEVTGPPGPAPSNGHRHARPSGKHALYSSATPAGDHDDAFSGDGLPARGVLTVACSSCGSVNRVGLLEFVMLQFPVGGWLPRGTYDRWMTCPACRRHTWVSVTWRR